MTASRQSHAFASFQMVTRAGLVARPRRSFAVTVAMFLPAGRPANEIENVSFAPGVTVAPKFDEGVTSIDDGSICSSSLAVTNVSRAEDESAASTRSDGMEQSSSKSSVTSAPS